MDRVMADYLARKLYGDFNQGTQGGDYRRGNDYPHGGRDNAGYDMRNGDMNYPVHGDMRDMRNGDFRDMPDRGGDMRSGDYGYPMDCRQGVKGTGPYGIGGSMYYGSRDRADGGDYGRGEDYGRRQGDYYKFKMPKLTKAEKHRWEQEMQNVDGTRGPHYDAQQVMQAAEKMGIRFNHFDEKDMALVMNMFYSDYCHVIKKYIQPDKELMFYADMAKAYFDDPDGPEPDDKLSRQYHCMTDHD